MDMENNVALSNANLESEQDNETAKALQKLGKIKEELGFLKDLFVRRLNDDKQKAQMINTLDEGARFAFIEPFLTDIILVLDRLEKNDDDFVQSVYEEIYDILHRRRVERIKVTEEFNPALCKAIKSNDNPDIDQSIMMGATIDYAIIYSSYYIEARRYSDRKSVV